MADIGINKFNRAVAKALAKQIATHAEGLADNLALDVEPTRSSFDATQVTVKLTFNVREVNGVPRAKAEWDAAVAGNWSPLEPSDFGGVFESSGLRYRISGYRPRARKRPVVATQIDTGKTYVFPEDLVAMKLGRVTPPTPGAAITANV